MVDESSTKPALAEPQPADIRAHFETWMTSWRAWAAEDKRLRPHAELFRSVDRMRDDLTAQPESLELVVAAGFLSSAIGAVFVDAHLITQTADITRDEATGDLLVRLTEGSTPRLEDRQLFAGLDNLDPAVSVKIERRLSETISNPLSADSSVILANWASKSLAGKTRHVNDRSVPPAARRGTLRSSPALVLRKRTNFALVSYYDAMIAALDGGATVPLGLAQLVESIDSTARLEWLGKSSADPTLEPLFPLPANRAQASIMDRLALDTGVVVEGPPGTGKSHTIANVMSALMAQGQRVLVTSEKSQALRVLRDKLPTELQDLCVSITDLARGGSEELNRSVSTIAERRNNFEVDKADRSIEDLAKRRSGAQYRRYQLEDRLIGARSAESEAHDFGGKFTGTLSDVISTLGLTATQSSWLPGPLYVEHPPLTTGEFVELTTLLDAVKQQAEDRRNQTLPPLAKLLPAASSVRRLCARAQQRDTNASLAELPLSEVKRLAAMCRKTLADAGRLDRSYLQLVDAVLNDSLGHHWTRAQSIGRLLEHAVASDSLIGLANVEVDVIDRNALDAFEALARLYEDGPFDKLRWLRTPREQIRVDDLQANARVDGAPATTAAQIRLVAEHLSAHLAINDAIALASALRVQTISTGQSRPDRITHVQRIWAQLSAVHSIVSQVEVLGRETSGYLTVDDLGGVRGAAGILESTINSADSAAALAELAVIADAFEGATGGADSAESAALCDALRIGDVGHFDGTLAPYDVAVRQQAEQLRLDELVGVVDSVAPTLRESLSAEHDTDWSTLSSSFEEAWAWRWARQEVEQRLTRPDEVDLDDQFDSVDAEIAALTATLAAESAWRACLRRMSSREMQALRTYQDNVNQLGLGNSKHSQRYRAAARAALHEAQSSVPAWIMPIRQVLATIEPKQDMFDVVIVDEASQADLSSLFLMWLAPRVIVVGDDKQCAPDRVPQTSSDAVFRRLDMYLDDLPIHVRNNFGLGASLFSLLHNRYAQPVQLREHFRSMPEIIEWSSAQFYPGRPLVPVRQFGAERLRPLRSTYVAAAHTTGSSATLVNEAEARSLVDCLCDCLADPDYEDRTLGVVVLQSAAQAKLIRSLMDARIPAEQRDARRLRVGTAPDFQGDERDVMLLSMVIAPGTATSVLKRELYQRRFNVAASRARDQLWLFHSVKTTDLSSQDLRTSLLSYIEAAPTVPVRPMPSDVGSTRQHADFSSMTAQLVFLSLRTFDYHVNPAAAINELVLDLVVTGAEAKLAIECDDERVRSSDEITERLRRELDLRRSGWTFFRVRASEFASAPDRVLVRLVEVLDGLGILPGEVGNDSPEDGRAWKPVTLLLDDAAEADEADEEAAEAEVAVPGPMAEDPLVEATVAPLPVVIEVKSPVRKNDGLSVELEPGETRPPRFDDRTSIRVDSRYGGRGRVSAPATQPSKSVSQDDVIKSIVYAQQRKQFSAGKTASDLGVSIDDVNNAVSVIEMRQAELRRSAQKMVTPAAMPRRVTIRPAMPAVERRNGIEALPAEVQGQLASLPAASNAAARVVLLAAARPNSPLTVRRSALLTGMNPEDAESVLENMTHRNELVQRQRGKLVEWVRPGARA
ncbi:AAA domain-containing protein [Rhodococcus sp. NPDC057297]|uniref:AAA domain-containing protein n=1 Tax=Rhodococcus sp. NPDC057297 TaxID=3346090 RepID=UPI00363F6DDD